MSQGRVIGVIPARWGSTRLPGKILIQVGGKPLIQWVLERVRQARRLDEYGTTRVRRLVRRCEWDHISLTARPGAG